MPVSQSASCSSIDVSGLPDRVAEALAGLAAVCREPLASEPCAAVFEEAERRVRESVNALGCEVLGAWIESLDDGALRVDRAGRRRFRVAAPAFARAGFAEDDHEHARSGDLPAGALPSWREPGLARARGREPGAGQRLADASGGPARADDDGPLHSAGSGDVLLGGGRHDASLPLRRRGASTLQRLARSLHERWESLGPQALDVIRSAEDIPSGAVSASVSLDGVMVALRAGEDGRAEACWREAACGTVSFHDAESLPLRRRGANGSRPSISLACLRAASPR